MLRAQVWNTYLRQWTGWIEIWKELECRKGRRRIRRWSLMRRHDIGTLNDPILVKSYGDEQYAGCTGSPADSHVTIWLGVRISFPFPSLILPAYQISL